MLRSRTATSFLQTTPKTGENCVKTRPPRAHFWRDLPWGAGSLDAQPHPTDLIFRTRIAQVAHCNSFPTNNPQNRRKPRQKPAAQRPFSGAAGAAPAAGFGLDSDHFCASFEAIWITKDLRFGRISTWAFQSCTGLVLNRKIQIFINFLTPEGRAQKQGRAVTKSRESSCCRSGPALVQV